jgi:chemotaxis protein CheC
MLNLHQINAYHLDVLKEIGNIGAGNATTALSKILEKTVDMKVPDVKIVSFDEMMDMMGGAENTVASVFLRIEGDAPGSMFFILPLEQASHFIRTMTGIDDFSLAKPPYSEMAMSALQEVGNIVAGSYLSALADFTRMQLYPSVPALSIDMIGAILTFGLIELSQLSDYAIVINTAVAEKEGAATTSVNGHFILLPNPDSIRKILESLGVTTDE